ncbi:uncharacterized protein LOC111831002 [Capsella rubella]|uniref:uncharacterized protein LOC111831002 n=1 Tax=Capsella rubella TaxID=81985 RepID=UPI000CD5A22A|nr:uncharacterized protein LOC111831002 [Capsella rubella]
MSQPNDGSRPGQSQPSSAHPTSAATTSHAIPPLFSGVKTGAPPAKKSRSKVVPPSPEVYPALARFLRRLSSAQVPLSYSACLPDVSEAQVPLGQLHLSDDTTESSPTPEFLNRYILQRRRIADLIRRFPKLNRPATPIFSSRFISAHAAERFQFLHGQDFIPMKILSAEIQNDDVRSILFRADLLPTVTEIDSFIETVVKEFYANLPEAEGGDSEVLRVFVRGSMYEFSPSLINRLFQLPNEPYPLNTSQLRAFGDLDAVAALLTDGQVSTVAEVSTGLLGDIIIVLHQISCFNWLPSTNHRALSPDRCVLLYLIAKGERLNFGKIVFDEIRSCASRSGAASSTDCLIFPNLIDQLLRFQRVIPSLTGDVLSSTPTMFVTPEAAAPTSGPSLTLAADLAHLAHSATTIMQRFSRGEYVDVCTRKLKEHTESDNLDAADSD